MRHVLAGLTDMSLNVSSQDRTTAWPLRRIISCSKSNTVSCKQQQHCSEQQVIHPVYKPWRKGQPQQQQDLHKGCPPGRSAHRTQCMTSSSSCSSCDGLSKGRDM